MTTTITVDLTKNGSRFDYNLAEIHKVWKGERHYSPDTQLWTIIGEANCRHVESIMPSCVVQEQSA